MEQNITTLDDFLNVLMALKKRHGGSIRLAVASDEEGNSYNQIDQVELCNMSESEDKEEEDLYLIVWPNNNQI